MEGVALQPGSQVAGLIPASSGASLLDYILQNFMSQFVAERLVQEQGLLMVLGDTVPTQIQALSFQARIVEMLIERNVTNQADLED